MAPFDEIGHLHQLSEFGIVRREGSKWTYGTGDIHAPKNSLAIGNHHNNWRQRAVVDALLPDRDGLHFTAVYSISSVDFQRLKDSVLALVEESRRVVGPSKEEELVCLSCDLFRV